MQYLWQWRLYGAEDKLLADGRRVRIIDPGRLNTDAGPDFFNAKIQIDGMSWAGNVELHLRASDWYRHGHGDDRAYDSVILHVVGSSDTYVTRRDGSVVPQLLLPFDDATAERYRALSESAQPRRCHMWIRDVPRLHLADWLDAAAMERLVMKSSRVADALRFTNGDWSQTVFITVARALGFGLNGEPMERVARSLPLSVTARHTDSVFQLEALLMGQAGLLADNTVDDQYYLSLREEYSFLACKYTLSPMPGHVWKMSRARPANSPYRRLAFLARLLQEGGSLLSRMLDAKGDVRTLCEIFASRLDGYWMDHYSFGARTQRPAAQALSESMLHTLLINSAAPLYHAYGASTSAASYEELAQDLLMALPAERNTVTRLWEQAAGVVPANAFESQALLQVRREYCEQRKCMRCRLGCKMLRDSVTRCRRAGGI